MSLPQDFVVWWQSYPRKVGKLAAEKAYEKARKRGVTQQQLLDGIAAYVQHKPAYADFCHPATWLTQGRYLDEYETPAAANDTRSWCQHSRGCPNRAYHDAIVDMEQRQAGRAERV